VSAREFSALATPVWVVVATLVTGIGTTVELVHWRHVLLPPADEHAGQAAVRVLRASVAALVWLVLVAIVQEGLLRATRSRARRPARARIGNPSLGESLLDDLTADFDADAGLAPAADANAESAGARGLSGKAARIYALARPEIPGLSVGLVALLGSTLSNLLIPKFFGGLVNAVVANDRSELSRQTQQLVLILVGGSVLTLVRAFIFNSAGERVVARLRGRLFARMLAQEAAFFDAATSGELVSRLTSDCAKLQSAATSELSVLLSSLAMSVISIVLMATTQWQLTLVCLGTIPPLALASVLYGKAIRAVSKSYQDAVGRASDVSSESLGALKTVRAFGAEPLALSQYIQAVGDPNADSVLAALSSVRRRPPTNSETSSGNGTSARRREGGALAPSLSRGLDQPLPPSAYALGVAKSLYLALFVAGVTLAFYLAMVAILWFGLRLVLSGEAALGELVSFVMYALQIGASFGALASLFSALMEAVGASERVFKILQREPLIPSVLDVFGSKGVVPARNGEVAGDSIGELPRVEFENVYFAYDKLRSAAPVLRGLSFKVPLGTTTALVGPSGAGKSTVGGLLLRLYEPSSGSVRIDGVDLRHIDARWLRQTVAVVSQEPVLFGCSIFDNIAYGARARAAADAAADSLAGVSSGRAGAEGGTDVEAGGSAEEAERELRAKVESAVERAHCSEFISGFAEGLQTMVGERGVRLSGGQKQRVAIARALLHDPPILLLDEATSALDAESEAAVSAALATLVAQRTTIVIAHRLSTIVGASQIVCLAQGAVVGAGTHTELLLNCPEYAALVRRQLHAASDNNLVGKGGPEMPGVGKLKPERVNI